MSELKEVLKQMNNIIVEDDILRKKTSSFDIEIRYTQEKLNTIYERISSYYLHNPCLKLSKYLADKRKDLSIEASNKVNKLFNLFYEKQNEKMKKAIKEDEDVLYYSFLMLCILQAKAGYFWDPQNSDKATSASVRSQLEFMDEMWKD